MKLLRPKPSTLRACITGAAVLLLAIVVLSSPLAAAEPPAVPEYKVKAAFLVNFVRYTTWPPEVFPSDDAPIIIGVLGNDPFGAVLERTILTQKSGRRLELRHVTSAEQATKCHLVFIAKSEQGHEAAWLAALADAPVVTIGESGQAIARGSLLEFVIVGNRVRFDANWAAMQRAGVKFSSQLLASAKKVYHAPTP